MFHFHSFPYVESQDSQARVAVPHVPATNIVYSAAIAAVRLFDYLRLRPFHSTLRMGRRVIPSPIAVNSVSSIKDL